MWVFKEPFGRTNLFDKFRDSGPEITWFEQEKLNDEETHLGFISLQTAK